MILAAILIFDGIIMYVFTAMAESDKYKKYRIRIPETYRIPRFKRAINVMLNMVLSLASLGFVFYYFGDILIGSHKASPVLMFGEVLAALLVYDFMYYFAHRSMHNPKAMKRVHGVHHYVRFPTSFESIYLHPVENILGLTLICLGIAIVGPISPESFLITFFLYSTINIIVHSNLVLPHPIFKLLNFWAIKHDMHHNGHLNKNFASIFPFWDQMFGTAN